MNSKWQGAFEYCNLHWGRRTKNIGKSQIPDFRITFCISKAFWVGAGTRGARDKGTRITKILRCWGSLFLYQILNNSLVLVALQPKAQKQQNPHNFLASQIPHNLLAVFFRWVDGKDRNQEPVGKVLLDFHHLANKWSLRQRLVLHLSVALSWSAVKTFMVGCQNWMQIFKHGDFQKPAKKIRGAWEVPQNSLAPSWQR